MRLANAEDNEHISSPGTDVESVMDVIADRRIREAMASGHFDNLENGGQPLDPARPVGDIMANANVVPPWVEVGRELDQFVVQTRGIRRAVGLAEAMAAANFLVARFNESCPPQLQRPKYTEEDLR